MNTDHLLALPDCQLHSIAVYLDVKSLVHIASVNRLAKSFYDREINADVGSVAQIYFQALRHKPASVNGQLSPSKRQRVEQMQTALVASQAVTLVEPSENSVAMEDDTPPDESGSYMRRIGFILKASSLLTNDTSSHAGHARESIIFQSTGYHHALNRKVWQPPAGQRQAPKMKRKANVPRLPDPGAWIAPEQLDLD